MMLIHRLDIKTYCSKIFEKQERGKCSISCPPFPHISMILNIHRIWYFSQNKQQDEESSSRRIPESFSWLQKFKLASPSSARCSLSCSSSLSSPQVPQPDKNGYRKSLYSDRVHSWRFNKSTRAPAPPLLPILGIYLDTMIGILGMITLICLNAQLHTPMYHFLSTLSFVDLCYSSAITPKKLVNFVSEKNTISHAGYMPQLYFCLVFVIAESYMLTVMAYDCYVAIWRPLLYNVIMSHWACFLLLSGVYVMSLTGSTTETSIMLKLSYCEIIISHYYHDILALMKLSCFRGELSYWHDSILFGWIWHHSHHLNNPCFLYLHPVQYPPHQHHRGKV